MKFLDGILKILKIVFWIVLIIIVIVILVSITHTKSNPTPNLAKLELKSMIINSDDMQRQIDRIKENPSIKGVLLEVNSPGGTMSGSIEIADLLRELHLPIVAYDAGVMASGSYYASIYSDYIVANRGALVGSIGVIFEGFDIENLLAKLGIQSQTLQAGEYKSAGTFTRQWTKEEKDYLQNLVNKQYDLFVSDVRQRRHLKDTSSTVFAEGKVFTAKQAKELGLIDEVGSKEDAIKKLLELIKDKNPKDAITKPVWLEKPKVENFRDILINNVSSKVLSTISSKVWM
ncbi:hypothetical protein BKH43_06250 [Helicobacter sp. 13S00401-1]|uniref:signal peptide peptidase SppA n=1 Tax=Helicobacter sp. 13S00401-1 TaxID=1905758 RepID=UPI000BA6F98D|nr:signal peptide peptidase SppA [Helicobacter sp. 13S00401-1]PAF49692.1 hypothetical protein BKH43_06250 [Helicobacter sp. 13S00401-1]